MMIERLRGRIESAMRGQGAAPFFSIETILLVLSVFYGGLMRLRAFLYEKEILPTKRLPCRVISIGNITAGGTGKTPMTVYVAQHIRDMGYRVAVVSRGYRGRLESVGGVVSDGRTVFKDADEAGDEAYLLARVLKGIPVVVGRRRYDAGMLAVSRFKPDVIVLDDAFQHVKLKRDVDLVLLDRHAPFGNGELLPRGTLREPASALRRADAIIFTRSGTATDVTAVGGNWRGRCPVFYTAHTLNIRKIEKAQSDFITGSADVSELMGKHAVAFSGLADNDQFFSSLKQAGCCLIATFGFADHHRYNNADLANLISAFRSTGADVLITTLKDYVKVEKWAPSLPGLVVVDASIEPVSNAIALNTTIADAVKHSDEYHQSIGVDSV